MTTTLMLLLLLAFQIPTNSPSDEWEFLAQASNFHGVINIHFAPKTIARNDDVVKVRLRMTNHYGVFFREAWHGSRESMPTVGNIVFDASLNCKKREVKAEGSQIYNPAGNLIATVRERETVKETPNSAGWIAFEYFCEKEGKKLTGPPTLKSK